MVMSPVLSSCDAAWLVLVDELAAELSGVLGGRVGDPVEQVLAGRVDVIAACVAGVSAVGPLEREARLGELVEVLSHDELGRRVLARFDARRVDAGGDGQ